MEYLVQARELGLGLGVASSSTRDWAEGHLSSRDLLGYFDSLQFRDDVANVKPDPELYLASAESLEVHPEGCLAIEDSANGAAAAKRAGMFCVAVPNPMTRDMALEHAAGCPAGESGRELTDSGTQAAQGTTMSLPENVTITRVEATVLEGERPRELGRNSQKPIHGRVARDRVVRVHTDQGVIGWGWSTATADDAHVLAARKLHEVFDEVRGTAEGCLMFDFPLWDLAGRVLGKPVHAMLGDVGADPVPVYDGSIYIEEIDPDSGRDEGLGPILDAVQMGLDVGYLAFKVKVGRGFRWMESGAGLRRDIEVLHAVRELIGPDMKLLIDANNGYTPAEARQVMREAGECDIYWFEEPFPEDKDESAGFRSFVREGGWETLVADGEGSEGRDKEFTEVVRAGGVDVVQFDLRHYTLTRWLRYMPVIAETGTLTAPHNFGSHLSGFYIPQFARGTGHFAMGETDIMAMPGVAADGYPLVDGMRRVPDTAGFGLELDAAAFEMAQRGEGAWVVESR